MSAGRIFVCYRREDSAGHAGRLYDRLNQRFPGRVFMDVAGIGAGTRWASVIEDTLQSCEVAVVLIGRRWLERGPAGMRRLDLPDDPLRAEILTALRLNLKIVPLLVNGAALPEAGALPPDIAPVIDWQALRVDDDDFDHDAARLVSALERQLTEVGRDPHLDSRGAKQVEAQRLMTTATAALAHGDHVTAAQTLRAVLSLDPAHAEAAHHLALLQPQPPPPAPSFDPQPDAPRPRLGRLAAFGALGVAALLVAVTVSVLIVIALIQNGDLAPTESAIGGSNLSGAQTTGGSTADRTTATTAAAGPTADPPRPSTAESQATRERSTEREREPAEPARAVPDATPVGTAQTLPPPPPAAPALAGEYAMVAYSEGGLQIPAVGVMRLVETGDGRYQFDTTVTNTLLGVTFQYRGILQSSGAYWTTTTLQTNDPRAVATPIANQMSFDGATLQMQNAYGQAAVWRKR